MKRKNQRNNYVLILIILIAVMSLGYAFLNTDLTINGTSKIPATSWNVFFDNVQITTGSVELSSGDVAPTIDSTTLTDISYIITLKEPGSFYEFTVDVKNTGTLDAMIGTITNKMNGVEISSTNPLPAYLNYSVTYSDGVPIEQNHLLEAGDTETYKVRVSFRTDIDPSDLPASGATISFSYGVHYIQSTNEAEERIHPVSFATDSWETISKVAKLGLSGVYHVGDTKSVRLSNIAGPVNNFTVRIANLSTPEECGTEGFSQTACGFVVEFANLIRTREYNSTNTTAGSWPASSIRTFINGGVNAAIYDGLPSDLKSVLIDTTVVTGHTDYPGESVFTSTDKLYLLSSHEVWEDDDGNPSNGISAIDKAYNRTRQLDYYKALNVTTSNYSGAIKKYNGNSNGWWLRTPSYRYGYPIIYVISVNLNGEVFESRAYDDGSVTYVSPAFRLG